MRIIVLLLVAFAAMHADCRMACQHPCCHTCRGEQTLSNAAPAVPASSAAPHWPDAGPAAESAAPFVFRAADIAPVESDSPPPIATPAFFAVLKV